MSVEEKLDTSSVALSQTEDLLRLLSAISGEAEKLNRPDVASTVQALTEEFYQRCSTELERLMAPPGNDLSSDPELVHDFILESSDSLASVEAHLIVIEKDPDNTESINAVFRAFHTIKGVAGFLGYLPIQQVSHEVETVLDRAREGKLLMNSGIIDLVLRAADYLKQCIGVLAGGVQAFPSPAALLACIRRPGNPTIALETLLPSQTKIAAAEPGPNVRLAEPTSTVKVNTAKMEYLVDTIGELVIAQSIVRHDPVLAQGGNPTLARNLAQLERVTEAVQKTALSMRMVAIRRLFGNMERLVRDLARRSGKEVHFEMAGESAELDRSIVEELADPLVHMIRNSVDHGIETAEERIAQGKPAMGTIRIDAHHEAGCILIRLSDDGRGMDPARILAKAQERGIVSRNARLSDDETLRLIFQPGFSTAEKITDISGRGVGMDVVLRNIQKLRGRVEVKSAVGAGSTFTLRLPLTLAIIDGLVVSVENERFIVPIFAMREMFCSTPETTFTIEGKNEMVMCRGALLPLVRLRERFGIEGFSGQGCILIVIQGRDREFCLAVDQLVGKQEVVIKNLGSCFRNLPGIAGGAILGDGRVGLILDVDSLAEMPR